MTDAEKITALVKALHDIARIGHYEGSEAFIAKDALIRTGEWTKRLSRSEWHEHD